MMQLDNTDHSFYLLGGEICHQGSSELNQLARLSKKCIHCHLGIGHDFMLFVKVKVKVSPRSPFTASSNLTLFSPFVKVKVHSLAPGNYVSAISMIFTIVDFHLLYLTVTKTVQFKFAALSLFSDLFMLYTKPADTKFTSEHNAASLKYSISRTGKKNE